MSDLESGWDVVLHSYFFPFGPLPPLPHYSGYVMVTLLYFVLLIGLHLFCPNKKEEKHMTRN